MGKHKQIKHTLIVLLIWAISCLVVTKCEAQVFMIEASKCENNATGEHFKVKSSLTVNLESGIVSFRSSTPKGQVDELWMFYIVDIVQEDHDYLFKLVSNTGKRREVLLHSIEGRQIYDDRKSMDFTIIEGYVMQRYYATTSIVLTRKNNNK